MTTKKTQSRGFEYTITPFQFDGEWHADIVGKTGVVVFTTNPWPTKEDALADARDWLNQQFGHISI